MYKLRGIAYLGGVQTIHHLCSNVACLYGEDRVYIRQMSLSVSSPSYSLHAPSHRSAANTHPKCRCQTLRHAWRSSVFKTEFKPQANSSVQLCLSAMSCCNKAQKLVTWSPVTLYRPCSDRGCWIQCYRKSYIYILAALVLTDHLVKITRQEWFSLDITGNSKIEKGLLFFSLP